MVETIIREFSSDDISALTDLYNHYILETAITFDLRPYTVEQRWAEWMSHYAGSGRYRLFVAQLVEDEPRERYSIVGYASSSKFASKAAYETSVETSIYLSKAYGGGGIGSRLYEALFAALGEEDVHRAYAGITLPNDASIAIHRKFGFEQAALYREVGRKFDRYWDVAWFERKMNN